MKLFTVPFYIKMPSNLFCNSLGENLVTDKGAVALATSLKGNIKLKLLK